MDRDGIINVDRDFVHRISDFEFREGIFDVARLAHANGLLLIVVTNQSGIARGFYSEDDFATLTAWMCQRFEDEDAPIDRVYHCPVHPDFPRAEHAKFESWRKPAPGMLLQAAQDFDIDLSASFMMGDRRSDLQAANAAGVGSFLFVLSSQSGDAGSGVEYCDDLRDAQLWLKDRLQRNTALPFVGKTNISHGL